MFPARPRGPFLPCILSPTFGGQIMHVHSFSLEQLEGRALLSAATLLDSEPVETLAPVIVQAASTHNYLAGAFNVAGHYEHPISPGNPDTGSHYEFNGTGRKAGLGKFRLSGELTTPGFINSARSRGQFVIHNGHGSITFSVVGP